MTVFRVVFLVASLLSFLNGALVLVSLVLVNSDQMVRMALVASLLVASLFAAVGVVWALLRRRLTDAVAAVARHPAMTEASASLRRLLGPMILAGLAVDAALLVAALAMLGRIRQGFAVFG